MDRLKKGDKVLIVWNKSAGQDIQNLGNEAKDIVGDGNIFLENSEILSASSHSKSTFDIVLSNFIAPHAVNHNENYFSIILNILKPGGQFILHDASEIISILKFNGFVDPVMEDGKVICSKPNFEVGSAVKLGKTVWKIDDPIESIWNAGQDDEMIDSDQLLDEDDLKKVEPAPLKVCGTTGQRKACANCSCGLAEELRGEVKEQPKSSCGSCYLGDAFRCASCPYLGMPAFKPGEQVLLDLKSDI